MIDIENEVFNYVANGLQTAFNRIDVSSEYVPAPKEFPHVSLWEELHSRVTGNVTLDRQPESACNLSYTANIYCNQARGKKKQAKDILKVIESRMNDLGFMLDSSKPTPDYDTTIYRITAI